MNSTCQGIPANPDVSGIGIRANLYATFIIMAVIPRKHSTEKLLDALHANAGVASFGFLITAIIQTIQNRLDLYHAIFAVVILSYLGLFVYASELIKWVIKNNKEIRLMALINHIRLGAHPRATRLEEIIRITTAIALIMTVMVKIMAFATYLVWSIYIWVNAETFGSTPECNTQVKVIGFLFRAVSPTNLPMRIFWIISKCLSAVFIITATILIIREGHRRNISEGGLIEAVFDSNPYSETVDKIYRSKPWVISSIFLTLAVFSIIWFEVVIALNKHLILPGETDWAFGQVLSLVMIVANVREILNFVRYDLYDLDTSSQKHYPDDSEQGSYHALT